MEEQQTSNYNQTLPTITKALTKTTNCTCRAKKVEGHDKKKIPALCARHVPPTFKFVRAPMSRSCMCGYFSNYTNMQTERLTSKCTWYLRVTKLEAILQ